MTYVEISAVFTLQARADRVSTTHCIYVTLLLWLVHQMAIILVMIGECVVGGWTATVDLFHVKAKRWYELTSLPQVVI